MNANPSTERGDGAAPRPGGDRIEARLLDILEHEIFEGAGELHADSPLFEHGLDSMATMQLLIRIEAVFGVGVPAADLTRENLATVGSLASLVRRLREAAA